MPVRKMRINIALEKPFYETIKAIAKQEGKSISRKARDFIYEALEICEDNILENFAFKREKTFNHEKGLTHDKTWEE
ncbi:MAG: antitoxin, RHH family protein [Candidatus Dadabacteria bacterium]